MAVTARPWRHLPGFSRRQACRRHKLSDKQWEEYIKISFREAQYYTPAAAALQSPAYHSVRMIEAAMGGGFFCLAAHM